MHTSLGRIVVLGKGEWPSPKARGPKPSLAMVRRGGHDPSGSNQSVAKSFCLTDETREAPTPSGYGDGSMFLWKLEAFILQP